MKLSEAIALIEAQTNKKVVLKEFYSKEEKAQFIDSLEFPVSSLKGQYYDITEHLRALMRELKSTKKADFSGIKSKELRIWTQVEKFVNQSQLGNIL